jgi:hypothetical protein
MQVGDEEEAAVEEVSPSGRHTRRRRRNRPEWRVDVTAPLAYWAWRPLDLKSAAPTEGGRTTARDVTIVPVDPSKRGGPSGQVSARGKEPSTPRRGTRTEKSGPPTTRGSAPSRGSSTKASAPRTEAKLPEPEKVAEPRPTRARRAVPLRPEPEPEPDELYRVSVTRNRDAPRPTGGRRS